MPHGTVNHHLSHHGFPLNQFTTAIPQQAGVASGETGVTSYTTFLRSKFPNFGQHMNAAAASLRVWFVLGPPCSAGNRTPGLRSCPRRDSCWPAGAASGVAFFWTPRGTEAPRERGLFSRELVRIKSLPCGPLCPAEVDKHGWSRSETSPRGKESRAGWEQQHGDLKEAGHVMNYTQTFNTEAEETVCFIITVIQLI